MWFYVITFIVLVGVLIYVIDRRGSTGAARQEDLSADPGYRPKDEGAGGPPV